MKRVRHSCEEIDWSPIFNYPDFDYTPSNNTNMNLDNKTFTKKLTAEDLLGMVQFNTLAEGLYEDINLDIRTRNNIINRGFESGLQTDAVYRGLYELSFEFESVKSQYHDLSPLFSGSKRKALNQKMFELNSKAQGIAMKHLPLDEIMGVPSPSDCGPINYAKQYGCEYRYWKARDIQEYNRVDRDTVKAKLLLFKGDVLSTPYNTLKSYILDETID